MYEKIKTGFQLQSNCDDTVETDIISDVLLNNKVGGQLELISNLMVGETCATAHFATAQGEKHRQHVIELFAIKGILIKTTLFE